MYKFSTILKNAIRKIKGNAYEESKNKAFNLKVIHNFI